MERMGCRLSRPTESTVRCQGKLRPGAYSIAGNVSSQFISGLLMAFPLMDGPCTLDIAGKLESAPYVDMTRAALALFPDRHSPGELTVEGDWSNGAFFLGANSLGNRISVQNLNPDSPQGDRMAAALFPQLCRGNCTIDASDIPDLVPILSVVAACHHGAVFENIRRLRIKESDRVASVIAMLESLGGHAEATENTLTVFGTGLTGGTVDSANDHRIAMSAAIASTACKDPVTILGAHCVSKSYPSFWEEFTRLGGNYEQYLR
jgi:3-phosphoshikimate 1-carboxyvinyltransferase